ncbi:outer membrane lipid asymmetry maintenance protein MlaD [Cobetia marina]|jgi:phospholipid/cholesterol/gamma-HCH transport system substrate-binding protein|uniref:Outer membrane lipid asymmetry maintenance protein MlaD n=1 Tax=Cobetia marina TaxID=28258 RepID=A0ABU9GJB7_COBMA|nr:MULTISPECIES: outer membrane lipid asymmetry maintenance protein MlaD [Cobetia]AOM02147.1 outer membrane lipid asymmetry maintenance protein MlaD [Cobetia marina]MDA5563616.1 outer membrane lipid asymmetry maintenance protein MlaD [Cobetia sp. MMG027]MDH2290698.1 outer membrane lipid asymmetry maintenance protein MlaD [Cobetia sp. 10Alg 146]MDH2372625.1 outer membrane lipid asymmetry maintenance protein MlaD [Cobetia sp. 3AK]MDI6003848.1 outer membrane lipid asymmetry maintenance protein Ml
MKRTRMVEFGVGLFVLAGFLGMVFLGLRVSGVTFQQADDTFVLNANFSGIGSLKPRSKVTMAGVAIGSVEKIELDPKWFDARVTMKLDSSLKGKLSKDTTAAILTSGLLGEQYVGLTTGGDPETLEDGDTIRDTQSALVLEELIQQFVSNFSKS